jgi:glucosamine--fructose-6-phosphate aminotransferase (isomerizing)
MCGIIGYVGRQRASAIITEGLKRLEYRGYDSVGIAINNNGFDIRKNQGNVEEVSAVLQFTSIEGHVGIGHTRWATHGAPCKDNAHPHHDCKQKVILAHNGVIENYKEIKRDLLAKGHTFSSETDSEVIAHLIEQMRNDGLAPLVAFVRAVGSLKGSYAIIAMLEGEEKLYVARKNSPLIIGIGNGELMCASDIPAMLTHTKTFLPLEEGDMAELTPRGYKIYDGFGNEISRKTITVDWSAEIAEKGGYPHFMLKEINDQIHFIHESLATDVANARKALDKFNQVHVIACGTSYHAGMVLKILLQKQMNKNAEAYIASEYSFVSAPSKDTLVIAISQSGETADTLQALRYAKSRNASVLSLTNVVQSSITRLSDEVVYLNAGPEVSVAATKTFVSQLAVIYKLIFEGNKNVDLSIIPRILEKTLETEEELKKIADKVKESKDIFFLGRGISYPIAMEGALKLKEISYLHAEAYPGGELKHGPLSLIHDGIPVIALIPSDETMPKMLGTLKEVKSRGALLIAFTDNPNIKSESDLSISIPSIKSELCPFSMIIPMQLLAYYVSVARGINPDRPRNLAKSVTVE